MKKSAILQTLSKSASAFGFANATWIRQSRMEYLNGGFVKIRSDRVDKTIVNQLSSTRHIVDLADISNRSAAIIRAWNPKPPAIALSRDGRIRWIRLSRSTGPCRGIHLHVSLDNQVDCILRIRRRHGGSRPIADHEMLGSHGTSDVILPHSARVFPYIGRFVEHPNGSDTSRAATAWCTPDASRVGGQGKEYWHGNHPTLCPPIFQRHSRRNPRVAPRRDNAYRNQDEKQIRWVP
jgi:hypothetical protein